MTATSLGCGDGCYQPGWVFRLGSKDLPVNESRPVITGKTWMRNAQGIGGQSPMSLGPVGKEGLGGGGLWTSHPTAKTPSLLFSALAIMELAHWFV